MYPRGGITGTNNRFKHVDKNRSFIQLQNIIKGVQTTEVYSMESKTLRK